MSNLYTKPTASSGAEDYHLSYRALLHERLALDTEDCFKLGTDGARVTSFKRKWDSSVEMIPKGRAVTGSSSRPKKPQGPGNLKSQDLHFLSFAMQRCRNMLKGNKCTNLNKYRFKKVSCGRTSSMKHCINEELPQKRLKEDVTSQPNSGSVSMSRQVSEVPEHESSMAHSNNNQSMVYNNQQRSPQWPRPWGHSVLLGSFAPGVIRSSTLAPEVSTPIPYWRRREIEQLKREAREERRQAARLTKMGLDCNTFFTRTDYELQQQFEKLDRIYYSL